MGTLIVSPKRQRRNLFNDSQDFGSDAWVQGNGTILSNAHIAPDGTQTADAWVDNAGGQGSVVQHVFVESGTYTWSAYLKAGDLEDWGELTWVGSTIPRLFFNLTDGVLGSGSGHSIVSAGNGWYRCSATYTEVASRSVSIYFTGRSGNASNLNTLGDGVSSSIILWGAQLELGNVATPYQRILNNKIERNPLA